MRAFEFLTELDVRYGAKRHTIGDIYGKNNLKVPKAKYKDKRTNKQKGIFKESVDDGGDCFESALKELMGSNPFGKDHMDNMTLVHAVVTGQGEIEGVKHGHAWNEIGDVVIDKSNGRNIVMRKEDYYKAGNINPNNTNEFKRYTRQEMSKMVSKFKTYGPWELPNGLAEGFAGIPDYKTMPAYKLKKASKGKHKFFLPTDAPVPASVSALENFVDGKKEAFIRPNFDYEWEEANRYPEFKKLGKDGWVELASKGKATTIVSAKDINNTDAADVDSFKTLDPQKQKRATAQLKSGKVEMPIVAVYSDGYKELVGGNTRLTAMLAKNGKATVWQFEVPDKILDEYKLDNERGLGSTPNNSNVDYMGFRTMMKPTTFLKLAKPLGDYRSSGYQELVQKIKSGEGIGSPFLSIEIPDGWEDEPADFTYPTRVTGHEGRHRMNAILELEGDVPVEVHLWGRFEKSELRRRYLTDEMFDELEKGLVSETGQYIANPFLSIQR